MYSTFMRLHYTPEFRRAFVSRLKGLTEDPPASMCSLGQCLLHGLAAEQGQVLYGPCADFADYRREGRAVPCAGQDPRCAHDSHRPDDGSHVVLQTSVQDCHSMMIASPDHPILSDGQCNANMSATHDKRLGRSAECAVEYS